MPVHCGEFCITNEGTCKQCEKGETGRQKWGTQLDSSGDAAMGVEGGPAQSDPVPKGGKQVVGKGDEELEEGQTWPLPLPTRFYKGKGGGNQWNQMDPGKAGKT